MEESNEVINEYDIIALGVNPDNKTIKVHVPIEEEQRNELAYSLAQIAKSMAEMGTQLPIESLDD
ncbi:hypothetical protein ACFX4I_18245 [Peribacillus sp. YIM B13472]|uniref:hypothetical protein n=1 Tax=Peribacillus sp. YIM B13472 TaxID=3366297 RepID=UPI0036725613